MESKKTLVERLTAVLRLVSLAIGIFAALVALIVAVINNWAILSKVFPTIWIAFSKLEWRSLVGLFASMAVVGIIGFLAYQRWNIKRFNELFVGRNSEASIFHMLLKNFGHDVTCLCIYGFAGIGKSGLLRQFARDARRRNINVIHGSIRGGSLVSFVIFTAQLQIHHLATIKSDPERAAADALLRSIRRRTVVLIDDYPETNELDQTMLWLAEEAQRQRKEVFFVIASRRKPPFSDFRPFQAMELKGLSKLEVKKLIEKSINERHLWIKESLTYFERLCDQTQGNPKLIEIICLNQRSWDCFQKSPDIRLFTIYEIERGVLTEVWESLNARLHESGMILAALGNFNPVLRGDKCARLIDHWTEVKDILLSRAILLASDTDTYTMHDLLRGYIYEKQMPLEKKREIHKIIAEVYEVNGSPDSVIFALRHFTAAQYLPGIKRVYMSAIKRMTLLGDYKGVTDLVTQISYFLDQDTEFVGILMKDLGFASGIIGKYEISLESFRKATSIFSGIKKNDNLAEVLRGTADTYRLIGRFEDALSAYRASELEFERVDDKSGISYSLIGMAKLFKIQGYYTKALTNYQKAHDALVISRASDEDVAWAVFGEAEVLRLMGQYERAQEIYTHAHDVFSRSDHAEGLGYTLWGTGEIYRLMGDYEKAMKDHLAALKIFEKVRDRRCMGWAMIGLGETLRVSRRYDEALKHYLYAKEHWTATGNTAEEPHAMLGLAETKRLLGTADLELYDTTLYIYRNKQVQSGIVHTLIGRSLARLGNWKLAAKDLSEAEHIARSRGFKPELNLIHHIYRERNPYEIHPLNFP